jgi:hypothetical protein
MLLAFLNLSGSLDGLLMIGVVVLFVVGLARLSGSISRHRERMAKIEHGIDPDGSPQDQTET